MSVLAIKIYEIPNRFLTINAARTKIRGSKQLIVIGITGSFGKTTTKEILSTVLSKKYRVLSPPQSHNTLFAIAKIINNQLKKDHDIFIVEMGAYKRGEIAELCAMTKPRIGILTGITNQHLERFGSEENIAKAKYELIESLPADGLAVFNLDSEPCAGLYQKTKLNKIGYSKRRPQADVVATKIITDTNGSNFDLIVNATSPYSNEALSGLLINLPGEHQISNALAAISVALYLKESGAEIKQALWEIKTPEHRLQILENPDGMIIIDDSYSSNAEGVHAAVDLVAKFSNRPKIIITPGLIELGKFQFEENKKFGQLIAKNFDHAVIVNKTNRQALLAGLLSDNEPGWTLAKPSGSSANDGAQHQISVADTLEEATQKIIPKLVKPSSLILFENDLPDVYL